MSLACVLLLCFLAVRSSIFILVRHNFITHAGESFSAGVSVVKRVGLNYITCSLSRTKYYMRIHKFLARSVFYFSVIFYIYSRVARPEITFVCVLLQILSAQHTRARAPLCQSNFLFSLGLIMRWMHFNALAAIKLRRVHVGNPIYFSASTCTQMNFILSGALKWVWASPVTSWVPIFAP